MGQTGRPCLTIGIIFLNETRSLKRCLEALAPLRERISCELIMADTGSTDGSREIAKRYADHLIDFPWVDDFAAARNAVMERASGKWYLTVDTDEYLDADISELTEFLEKDGNGKNIASLIQRNYTLMISEGSPALRGHILSNPKGSLARNASEIGCSDGYEAAELNGDYADFMAVRLVRLLPGVHYEGAVHEQIVLPKGVAWETAALPGTILHHDGYAKTTKERERAKQERNRTLLKETLEKEPENLSVLVHYIESSRGWGDYEEWVRESVRLVNEKKPGWEYFGPAVMRNAVRAAYESGLDAELAEWISRSEELFPESFLTGIDVECYACAYSWNKGDYEECVRHGEKYLAALKGYRAGRGERETLASSVIYLASPAKERQTRMFLAEACLKAGKIGQAGDFLPDVLRGHAGKQVNAVTRDELQWLDKEVRNAVRRFDWTGSGRENPEGMELARLFALVEEGILSAFYKAENLNEEKIGELPARHRFGWHAARAFAGLDAGNLGEYVRELKAGLACFKEYTGMVEYLTENTPGLKAEEPPAELMALAEQVRTILSLYPKGAPEVAALKATSAYKQVARFIEDGCGDVSGK